MSDKEAQRLLDNLQMGLVHAQELDDGQLLEEVCCDLRRLEERKPGGVAGRLLNVIYYDG